MYLMKDITRDGAKVLRERAKPVTFPLSDEDKQLAHDMMAYLVISQDEEQNEKYHLRPGVGLAAPQVGQSKAMAAVLVPGDNDEILFKEVLINPRIISNSVQHAALAEGEGCLSVDKDVPGYVVRADRITIAYQNEAGEHKKSDSKTIRQLFVNMKSTTSMAFYSMTTLTRNIPSRLIRKRF